MKNDFSKTQFFRIIKLLLFILHRCVGKSGRTVASDRERKHFFGYEELIWISTKEGENVSEIERLSALPGGYVRGDCSAFAQTGGNKI